MSYIWFYHHGGHESYSNNNSRRYVKQGSYSRRNRRPMRERSYRQFPHHRNSGVLGLSKSIETLPPPPQ